MTTSKPEPAAAAMQLLFLSEIFVDESTLHVYTESNI